MKELITMPRRLARVRRLLDRQPDGGWPTTRYQPAIQATRQESPGISRASLLCEVNRTGRAIHLLSLPERAAALVALASPQLVDMHEQRLLPALPDVHPLFGHPEMRGVALPGVIGTFRAFELLGAAKKHPVIRLKDDDGLPIMIPDLLVGDLLLILRDAVGLYCVNWTVKATASAFGARIDWARPVPADIAADKASLRSAAEELHYASAGIPSARIDGSTFPNVLVDNLLRLFSWQSHRREVGDLHLPDLVPPFIGAMHGSATLLDVRRHFMQRWRRPPQHFLAVVGALIWDRMLRVDLLRPILLDGPLMPEVRDPHQVYAHLFARGVPV